LPGCPNRPSLTLPAAVNGCRDGPPRTPPHPPGRESKVRGPPVKALAAGRGAQLSFGPPPGRTRERTRKATPQPTNTKTATATGGPYSRPSRRAVSNRAL